MIEFSNGYSISIINHYGSYTDNRHEDNEVCWSNNAEIAIFNGDKWVTSEIMRHLGYDVCDDVFGHVSANLLAIVINYVSVIKGDE